MATLTTSYDAPAAESRTSMLRRLLTGAAALDVGGGIFCFAAAGELARWLSIPREGVYVTGALFLLAAAAGALTLRRNPLKVAWIVGANELFALWCVVMLAVDHPNTLGAVLLVIATVSSAGTGAAELALARRR
ncbi:MAG: hypothetical protein JO222_08355 [Frankiales bacterium]|nr:hypothetical protein [Frankiales bacterium]